MSLPEISTVDLQHQMVVAFSLVAFVKADEIERTWGWALDKRRAKCEPYFHRAAFKSGKCSGAYCLKLKESYG